MTDQPPYPASPTPGQPAGGPPPGWTPAGAGVPPAGYTSSPGYQSPPSNGGTKVGVGLWLALGSVVAMAGAVSVNEDGDNGWGRIGVWAAFAIAAAALTLAPVVREQINLDAHQAAQVAVGGAVALAAFWVLFILPSISQNTSFVATVGCVAAGGAAWLAPGRSGSSTAGPPSSTGGGF